MDKVKQKDGLGKESSRPSFLYIISYFLIFPVHFLKPPFNWHISLYPFFIRGWAGFCLAGAPGPLRTVGLVFSQFGELCPDVAYGIFHATQLLPFFNFR